MGSVPHGRCAYSCLCHAPVGSHRLLRARAPHRRGEQWPFSPPTGLLHPQFLFPCASLRELSRQERAQAQRVPNLHHHNWVCSAAVAAEPCRSSSRPLQNAVLPAPTTYVKTTGRIVAIGDIHGDIDKAIAALEIAGVLERDADGRPLWCGGNTVAVQLGDVLDRGDTEIGVVMLLRDLDRQAQKVGGALFMLNGNHESLNVCGDFRYATHGGFREAAVAAGLKDAELDDTALTRQARARMYAPGGPMAMELAKNSTVLVVNNTVFAHGGLTPAHVKYGLERLNLEVAAWMRGERGKDGTLAPPPFLAMGDASSVMWNRQYGKERFGNPYERYASCKTLQDTLKLMDASHLVIGHTIQMNGANCECNGRVWRIDVGMSSGILDAVPQVLEIEPADESGHSEVRLLEEPPPRKGAGLLLPACTLDSLDWSELRQRLPQELSAPSCALGGASSAHRPPARRLVAAHMRTTAAAPVLSQSAAAFNLGPEDDDDLEGLPGSLAFDNLAPA